MRQPHPEARVLELVRAEVASAGDRRAKGRRAAEVIRRAGGYRWVGVYDVGADEIAVVGWDGPWSPTQPRFARSEGLCGAAAAAGEAVIVADVSTDPRYLTTHATTRSEIVVPVVAGGGVVGLIDVESERANAFGEADKQLLQRCASVIVPLWRPRPLAARSGRPAEAGDRAEPASQRDEEVG